jgi:hypothetical protein
VAEDPSVVSKSAILQSITTEAGGFYTTVTTVASAFLGASLLFLDKFLIALTACSFVFLVVSWGSLVASIAFVARVRFLNLRSAQFALKDDFASADAIDREGQVCSDWAQRCLIAGMVALVFVGIINVWNRKEGQTVDKPNTQALERTIPYGSLQRPATAAGQQTPVQANPEAAPVQTPPQAARQTPSQVPHPSNQPQR